MTDTIRKTLADLNGLLEARRVPFAIIGGIAVTVRGEPRFTADVDAVIGVELKGALDLLAALPGSAFRPLFPEVAEVVERSYILPLRHQVTAIKVDLAVGPTGFERRLIARAEMLDLGGVTLPIARAEDLLVMKALAGRPRDVEDARGIIEKQAESLDWDYVLSVGKDLGEAIGQDLLRQLLGLRERRRP